MPQLYKLLDAYSYNALNADLLEVTLYIHILSCMIVMLTKLRKQLSCRIVLCFNLNAIHSIFLGKFFCVSSCLDRVTLIFTISEIKQWYTIPRAHLGYLIFREVQGISSLKQGILRHFRPYSCTFRSNGLFRDMLHFTFWGRRCIPPPLSRCTPVIHVKVQRSWSERLQDLIFELCYSSIRVSKSILSKLFWN